MFRSINNSLFYLAFCLFLLLGNGKIFCQDQPYTPYFHELEIDGQPFDKKTNVLFEDSYGYLWIGTNNGLYRYDGYELKKFQHDVFDPQSLPNNNINSVAEDDRHNLWLGSESYLIHYVRDKNAFEGFYKNTTARVLNKTLDGKIWVHLNGNGILMIDPVINKTIKDSSSFSNHINYLSQNQNILSGMRHIYALFESSDGRKWMATSKGLYFLDNKNIFRFSGIENKVTALTEYGKDGLLAISGKGILMLPYNKEGYQLKDVKLYPQPFTDDGATPSSMVYNSDNGELWVGTQKGLYKGNIKNNTFSFTQKISSDDRFRGSLNSADINSLILDRYGNLWLGSQKGVNKFLGRTSVFRLSLLPAPQKNARTQTVFLDKDKNLWLGLSTKNVFLKEKEKDKMMKTLQFDAAVSSIKYDFNQEKVLIASGKKLYSIYNSSTLKQPQTTVLKSFKRRIKDFLPISENEIWLGLWSGGLNIFKRDMPLSAFQKKVAGEFKNFNISVFLMDSKNNLWIGTRGEGLYKIDMASKKMEHYLPLETPGLSSNAILSLLEDREGNIWIGTRGGGLNEYISETEKFKTYGKDKGLRSNTISALEQDRSGAIWASTQDGISRWDKKQGRFVNFGLEDGVTESQFNFNSSSYDPKSDQIYFGCSGGYYTVDTKNFEQSDLRPKTVITDVNILSKSRTNDERDNTTLIESLKFGSGSAVELPYDKNTLNFEFAALDLTAPYKNKYAHKLEGVNDYWIYTTAANRNATYNNLAPGDYTFKVKASNSDGVWNEDPAHISFNIAPPLWKSPPALCIYVVLLTLLLIAAVILIRRWYQLKKNLVTESISRQKDNEHNRMKMVFFTDISHELRTPLTLILGTIEKVIRQGQYTLGPLTAQRIYNNSLRIDRMINQIMDIRKYDVGEFSLSVAKKNAVEEVSTIKNAFNDFASIYNINFDFKSAKPIIKGWYDSDILEKILFNLLSNAFKYTAEQGKITLSMDEVTQEEINFNHKPLVSGRYMKCIVRDNGVGIPEKELQFIFDRYYQATKMPTHQVPGTGIGMELVQKLVDSHHGAITVTSEENKFTEFTFALPLQKSHYAPREFSKKTKGGKKVLREQSEEVLSINSIDAQDLKKVEHDSGRKEKNKPKVLLVEDNPELRLIMKEELIADFTVMEAANGKEGYQTAVKQKPQLIISDILMPVKDGVNMLKNLKKNPEVSHIPVFMLTAKESHEVKIECLSLGADDYIEKPFSLEFLKWKSKNVLLTRKQLREKYSKVITAAPAEPERDTTDEKFIRKLMQIIEDSMDDNLLNVEYLAAEAGMSRANLYRKLQAILNETPVNFIKKIKLKRAAQLLVNDNLYVSEVAYMTGFKNQKYFSKCFSKHYGMSPTDYIKEHAPENEKAPLDLDDLT